jgi:hypothetical protein
LESESRPSKIAVGGQFEFVDILIRMKPGPLLHPGGVASTLIIRI